MSALLLMTPNASRPDAYVWAPCLNGRVAPFNVAITDLPNPYITSTHTMHAYLYREQLCDHHKFFLGQPSLYLFLLY